MKLIPGLLLVLVALVPLAHGDWSMSEHGQLTPSAVATDSLGNKILFCSPVNGFWLSENAGQSWEHINDRILESGRLYAGFAGARTYVTAVDPNADTLVINARSYEPKTYQSEYHSFDGGMTWEQYSLLSFWPDSLYYGSSGDRILIPRNHSERVYFPKSVGIGITYGGDVWNIINLSHLSEGLQGVFFEQDRSDTIYMYGHYDGVECMRGGVVASYDGGLGWQRLTDMENIYPGEGYFHDMIRISPSSFLLLHASQTEDEYPDFFRTDDEGETWYPVYASGLPDCWTAPRTFCYVPERPGRVLIGATSNTGVWESNDYGYTWNRVFRGLPINGTEVLNIQRNEYSGQLYISLHGQGLYRSLDFGDTWQLVSGPPCGIESIEWRGITVHEGGIAQTSKRGYLWYARGESTSLIQHEFPVYEDSWTAGYAINMNSNELIYVQNRHSFQNTDQVLTIRSCDFNGTDEQLLPALTLNSTPDYAIIVDNGDSTTYVGINRGQNSLFIFDEQSTSWLQRDYGFYGFQPQQHDERLYVFAEVNSEWKIAVSNDVGISWDYIEFPEPLDHDLWSFQGNMLFHENGMYVKIENRCWKYENEQWQMRGVISNDYNYGSNLHWEIIPSHTDILLVAGTTANHKLWSSHDGGWNWGEQEIEVPEPYCSETTWQLKYDPWRDRLWLDTGVGLAYLDDPTSAVGEDVWVFQPANYVTLDAYPNPFNASTMIRYTLTRPGDVKVTVFDLLGRRVAELYDGVVRPGEHTVSFDGSGLSSGTYFLHLDTPDRTLNRKLTLVK